MCSTWHLYHDQSGAWYAEPVELAVITGKNYRIF